MKKIAIALFVLLSIALWADKTKFRIKTTEVKPLSQLGEVNLEAIGRMKGQWLIRDSRFILEFTDRFACMIDGLRYFHYKRVGTTPRYPYIFTIVKSKQSGKYFFARGYYQDRRLYGTTSMMELKENQLIVYSAQDPKKIYFLASPVKAKEE
jgi:hypothetical protein